MRVLLLNLGERNRLLGRHEHHVDVVYVCEQQRWLPGHRKTRRLACVENLAHAMKAERAREAWDHERPLEVREHRGPRIKNALRARLWRVHYHLGFSGRAGSEEDDIAVAPWQSRGARFGGGDVGAHP